VLVVLVLLVAEWWWWLLLPNSVEDVDGFEIQPPVSEKKNEIESIIARCKNSFISFYLTA
jgi:hypothetical protein